MFWVIGGSTITHTGDELHIMIIIVCLSMGDGRGISRGVSRVSKNKLGLLNWHISQYTLTKQSRLMDNLIKQSWHCWSHPFICLFTISFLSEVDLEEEKSFPRPRIPHVHSLEIRGIFVNLCTNSIIKCNFCTSTWNNLYLVSYVSLHLPHPNPVIHIPLVSPT